MGADPPTRGQAVVVTQCPPDISTHQWPTQLSVIDIVISTTPANNVRLCQEHGGWLPALGLGGGGGVLGRERDSEIQCTKLDL